MCYSYQNGGDKLVEEDNLDASHSQCDRGVNFRHVQIGVSVCCICKVYHAEGKHLLIRYRHSLRGESGQESRIEMSHTGNRNQNHWTAIILIRVTFVLSNYINAVPHFEGRPLADCTFL